MALILSGNSLEAVGSSGQGLDASPLNPLTSRRDDARWLPLNAPYMREGGNARIKGWGSCTSWTVWELICRHSAIQEVITFLAESVAMLESQMLTVKDADGCRRPLAEGDELTVINREPAPNMTLQEWTEAILWDYYGFANAFILKVRFFEGDRLWLLPLPAELITPAKGGKGVLSSSGYNFGFGDKQQFIPADEMIHLAMAPTRGAWGRSPLIGLADALAEQAASAEYRSQIYENGVSAAGFAQVPQGVELTDERLERLRLQLQNRHAGAKGAGSVALLPDGIEWASADVDPRSLEHLDIRKLTKAEVRSRYGITDSSSAGSGDGAAYASKAADMAHLYGNVLAPKVRRIDARMTLELRRELQREDFERITSWDEKLKPDPEAMARANVLAVGGPYKAMNEARTAEGLKGVEGGDQILRPLNHDVWGDNRPTALPQPAAKESPEQVEVKQLANTFEVKAITTGAEDDDHRSLLERTFKRQAAAALKAFDKGEPAAMFDRARWDRELAQDLTTLTESTAEALWVKWADELDIDEPGSPDWAPYAVKEAEVAAVLVNDNTELRLSEALDADEPRDAVSAVFTDDRRTKAAATRAVATIAGFVGVAAGTKSGFTHKRWVDGSGDSDRHPPQPATVPIGQKFSNGGRWPGEGDDTFGCDCYLVLTRG